MLNYNFKYRYISNAETISAFFTTIYYLASLYFVKTEVFVMIESNAT